MGCPPNQRRSSPSAAENQRGEDQQTVDRIRDILKPQEFTRVDRIIDLVFSATKEVVIESPVDGEAAPSTPKKGKKFTPVNFRSACIDRLQNHLKETLVKQSSAVFATPDGSIAVSSAISVNTSRPTARVTGSPSIHRKKPGSKDSQERG